MDEAASYGKVLLGPGIVLHEIVPVGHTCAPVVPIPCNELDAVFTMRPRQHRAVEVGKDSIIALQPAGFEFRSSLHSSHILQRLSRDVFGVDEGFLRLWCGHILPSIEHAALAGDAAELCAIPIDRQLRIRQRLGFISCPVQASADFLKVAELLFRVVVIHSKNSFPQKKKAGIQSRIPARKYLVGIKIWYQPLSKKILYYFGEASEKDAQKSIVHFKTGREWAVSLVQVLPNAHNWLCVSIKHTLEKRGIKTLKPLISQEFQVSVSILVTQDGAEGGI